MFLNYIPAITPEDRERMRLKPGDAVTFEGRKYIIESLGLKYANIVSDDDEKIKGLAKVTQLARWYSVEESNESENLEWLRTD